jgi:NAD(P)-dependent dehydrogenase (short-subunit alcohol dehydrogenase family)
MTRGILLAGNESSLSVAIATEAAKRVEQFVATFIPNRFTDPAGEKTLPAGDSLIPLSWNPGSPVSARTLILAAENRLEQIHEAILICAPPALRKPPADLTSSEIELMINDHIKGWFFLVKELSAVFKLRQSGTLAFALSELEGGNGKDEPPDILGPSVVASFRAFVQSVLAGSQNEPFQVMGFSAPAGADVNGFGTFVFKTLDEGGKRNNGKWHKFGRGFFGR